MHKDEMEGSGKEITGKAKKAAGEMTDNERLKAEGSAEKTEGKVQKGAGELKESARKALKH